MKIKVFRSDYSEKYTSGIMTVDNLFFGYTMEDKVRAKGLKVKAETAIPTGVYKVILNLSTRFKRIMPLLLNVENFAGIRIHGGNTSADTEGCILIAKRFVSDGVIQGSLEKPLTELMKSALAKGEDITIEIIDTKHVF